MSFESIPLELRQCPQWLVWDPARGKMPLQRDLTLASIHDAGQFLTFEEAVAIGKGVGFVFTPDDPFGGFDLDPIPNDAPNRDAILAEQFAIFNDTTSYAERSPSKLGLHIIARGNLPHGRHPKYIGVFTQGRFFTFTGDVVRPGTINNEQHVFDRYAISPTAQHQSFASTESDDEVCARLNQIPLALKLGSGDVTFTKDYPGRPGSSPSDYYSWSEADQALINLIGYQTSDAAQIERIFCLTALHRPTGKGRDYLANTIKKAIRPALPAIVNSLASPLKEAMPIPKEPLNNPYLTPVPGLLGEIASFIYNSSTRPVPEIALAGAIGFMAGICGRSWNISNTGLNVYLLLLSETGTGKESISSGIEQLFSQLRKRVPAIDDFAGPGRIASGPALITELADRKTSCLSIVGEFGIRLQRMTQNANTGDLALLGDLLDLYTKSGQDKVLRAMIYADKAKNTKTIHSPAFSLIGETEPTRFFNIISEDMIAAGLLPRFIMIEYKGIRVPRRVAPTIDLNPQVLDYLSQMAAQALSLSAQGKVVNINDGPGMVILDAFDVECDAHINSTNISVVKHLWNRGHLNALKLAALAATGYNFINPEISEYIANWAVSIVRYSIEMLVGRFNNGGVGMSKTGEDKMFEDVREIISSYITSPQSAIKSEGEKVLLLHADGIIPNSTILKRVNNRASFRNSSMPTTRALEQVIKTMCDNDQLLLMDRNAQNVKYGTAMKAYKVKGF